MSVGYKSQNNYDDYNEKQRRKLPWRQRYDWPATIGVALFAASFVWLVFGPTLQMIYKSLTR